MSTADAILLFGFVFAICMAVLGHEIGDGLKEIARAIKERP